MNQAGLARHGELERRSAAGLGFNPDAAVVSLDDALADGQADAGTGILVARVQPFKKPKDQLAVLRLNADAVVGDRKKPVAGLILRANVNHRRPERAAVFDGVADQVLKK